jgi:hypothetical protein
MWRYFLFFFSASIAVSLGGCSEASAQDRCRVVDPTGTPLNVRTTPNGHVVGALNNGVFVRILDRASNVRGKPGCMWEETRIGCRLGGSTAII